METCIKLQYFLLLGAENIEMTKNKPGKLIPPTLNKNISLLVVKNIIEKLSLLYSTDSAAQASQQHHKSKFIANTTIHKNCRIAPGPT
jgi:hypothetical protein